MIMSGSKDAAIQSVQIVDIHGTRFYDIAYSHDEAPSAIRTARIGTESAFDGMQKGDHVSVHYLMNVVTGISRKA